MRIVIFAAGSQGDIQPCLLLGKGSLRSGFDMRIGGDEQTTIDYQAEEQTIYIDRSKSGISSFEHGFARIHSASMVPMDGRIRLRIFMDRSSVDVFGNDGLVVLSDSIFPSGENRGLKAYSENGVVTLNTLDIYRLNPGSFISSETTPEHLFADKKGHNGQSEC